MLISREEFTPQKLLEIYEKVYMDAHMDNDGDVIVRLDGATVIARALKDRPFFVLSTIWGLKPGASRQQILELCNRVNDHMIMVRCAYPEASPRPIVWVDHWTMTEGGISDEEVVKVTRRYVKVIRDGFSEYDTDDIVG